jgi:hypothetical protein
MRVAAALNGLHALKLFFRLKRLLARNIIDTLFILSNAVGSVLLFYYYVPPDAKQFSMNLSWTLVSFAFIFPLTMTIRRAVCPPPTPSYT